MKFNQNITNFGHHSTIYKPFHTQTLIQVTFNQNKCYLLVTQTCFFKKINQFVNKSLVQLMSTNTGKILKLQLTNTGEVQKNDELHTLCETRIVRTRVAR